MNHPALLTLLTGNPAPFLYTSTSLLPEHSVLTGRNGQQGITCRSGGEETRPEIWMGSELVPSTGTANFATIGLGTQNPNGLYHCLSAQSQREYFSLFLTHSGELRMSIIYPTNNIQSNPFLYIHPTEYYASGIDRMCMTPHGYITTCFIMYFLQSLLEHPMQVSQTTQCGPSHHQMAAEWRDIL